MVDIPVETYCVAYIGLMDVFMLNLSLVKITFVTKVYTNCLNVDENGMTS